MQASGSAAAKYDAKYQEAASHLTAWKTSIHGLFSKLGCNTAAMVEVLGNQGVTDANVMQYMGIVEQRITEVVNTYLVSREGTADELAMELRCAKEGSMMMGIAASTQRSLFSKTSGATSRTALLLSVNPPSWDDLSSDEGSDDEVCSVMCRLLGRVRVVSHRSDCAARTQAARPLTLEKLHSTPLRFRRPKPRRQGDRKGGASDQPKRN